MIEKGFDCLKGLDFERYLVRQVDLLKISIMQIKVLTLNAEYLLLFKPKSQFAYYCSVINELKDHITTCQKWSKKYFPCNSFTLRIEY